LKLVQEEHRRAVALARERSGEPHSPWDAFDGFQLGGHREQALAVMVEGERQEVRLSWSDPRSGEDSRLDVEFGGGVSRLSDLSDAGRTEFVATPEAVLVFRENRQTRVALHDPFDVDLEHINEGGIVKAPMHGKLIAVFVKAGDKVEKGQRLAILEAMKMEHALLAPSDAEVVEIAADAGAQVAEGATLIVLKVPPADD
jgi:3-methylcrotonyl-CoA carboxylase alpha subunit